MERWIWSMSTGACCPQWTKRRVWRSADGSSSQQCGKDSRLLLKSWWAFPQTLQSCAQSTDCTRLLKRCWPFPAKRHGDAKRASWGVGPDGYSVVAPARLRIWMGKTVQHDD